MTRSRAGAAQALLSEFLLGDVHYLASAAAYGDSGADSLRRAIALFLRRPSFGFVWLAYKNGQPVACCVVCYAISTSMGSLVVKLDDVYVRHAYQGKGIGTEMLKQLKRHLSARGVRRIDTSWHLENRGARRFYERLSFVPLGEERLSCPL